MPDTGYGRRTMRPGNDGTRVPGLYVSRLLASVHLGKVSGDDALRFLQLRVLGEPSCRGQSCAQVSEPILTRLPLEWVGGRNPRMFCRPCSSQAYITRRPALRRSSPRSRCSSASKNLSLVFSTISSASASKPSPTLNWRRRPCASAIRPSSSGRYVGLAIFLRAERMDSSPR